MQAGAPKASTGAGRTADIRRSARQTQASQAAHNPPAEVKHMAVTTENNTIVQSDDDADSPASDMTDERQEIVACPCGVRYDDGKMMIECDTCNVWGHVRCHGLRRSQIPFLDRFVSANNTSNDVSKHKCAHAYTQRQTV